MPSFRTKTKFKFLLRDRSISSRDRCLSVKSPSYSKTNIRLLAIWVCLHLLLSLYHPFEPGRSLSNNCAQYEIYRKPLQPRGVGVIGCHVRIPHVHGYSFVPLGVFLTDFVKKGFQSGATALLSHSADSCTLQIQYHSEISILFLIPDLADEQQSMQRII